MFATPWSRWTCNVFGIRMIGAEKESHYMYTNPVSKRNKDNENNENDEYVTQNNENENDQNEDNENEDNENEDCDDEDKEVELQPEWRNLLTNVCQCPHTFLPNPAAGTHDRSYKAPDFQKVQHSVHAMYRGNAKLVQEDAAVKSVAWPKVVCGTFVIPNTEGQVVRGVQVFCIAHEEYGDHPENKHGYSKALYQVNDGKEMFAFEITSERKPCEHYVFTIPSEQIRAGDTITLLATCPPFPQSLCSIKWFDVVLRADVNASWDVDVEKQRAKASLHRERSRRLRLECQGPHGRDGCAPCWTNMDVPVTLHYPLKVTWNCGGRLPPVDKRDTSSGKPPYNKENYTDWFGKVFASFDVPAIVGVDGAPVIDIWYQSRLHIEWETFDDAGYDMIRYQINDEKPSAGIHVMNDHEPCLHYKLTLGVDKKLRVGDRVHLWLSCPPYCNWSHEILSLIVLVRPPDTICVDGLACTAATAVKSKDWYASCVQKMGPVLIKYDRMCPLVADQAVLGEHGICKQVHSANDKTGMLWTNMDVPLTLHEPLKVTCTFPGRAPPCDGKGADWPAKVVASFDVPAIVGVDGAPVIDIYCDFLESSHLGPFEAILRYQINDEKPRIGIQPEQQECMCNHYKLTLGADEKLQVGDRVHLWLMCPPYAEWVLELLSLLVRVRGADAGLQSVDPSPGAKLREARMPCVRKVWSNAHDYPCKCPLALDVASSGKRVRPLYDDLDMQIEFHQPLEISDEHREIDRVDNEYGLKWPAKVVASFVIPVIPGEHRVSALELFVFARVSPDDGTGEVLYQVNAEAPRFGVVVRNRAPGFFFYKFLIHGNELRFGDTIKLWIRITNEQRRFTTLSVIDFWPRLYTESDVDACSTMT